MRGNLDEGHEAGGVVGRRVVDIHLDRVRVPIVDLGPRIDLTSIHLASGRGYLDGEVVDEDGLVAAVAFVALHVGGDARDDAEFAAFGVIGIYRVLAGLGVVEARPAALEDRRREMRRRLVAALDARRPACAVGIGRGIVEARIGAEAVPDRISLAPVALDRAKGSDAGRPDPDPGPGQGQLAAFAGARSARDQRQAL